MEEGLRHGGLAGVVGELVRLPLTPSRRLQLAAEASGVIAFQLCGARAAHRTKPMRASRAGGFPPHLPGRWSIWTWDVPAGASIFCAAGVRKPTPLLWRLAMRRVVSLFLPTWATDRLRRRNGGLPQPEVPLITAMQDGNQRVIAAVDGAARRLKLHPGMTIAHAQSLVPGLHIHDAMSQEDDAALARLSRSGARADPPDFSSTSQSSAHLFRGETAFLQDLKNRTVLRQKSRHGRARRLDLVFMRVDNIAQAIRIGTSRPNAQYRAPSQTSCRERLVLVESRLWHRGSAPSPLPGSKRFDPKRVRPPPPLYGHLIHNMTLQSAIRAIVGLDETGWTGVS